MGEFGRVGISEGMGFLSLCGDGILTNNFFTGGVTYYLSLTRRKIKLQTCNAEVSNLFVFLGHTRRIKIVLGHT